MKRILAIITILSLLFIACAKVPITGRRQLKMLPESVLLNMSLTSYREFISQNKAVPLSNSDAQLVKTVGNNLTKAVILYLRQIGQSKRVKKFNWEYNLLENSTVNAWCMPGGKVVFYTGILPFTQDETGIAVVMGHEIAHAVARHGNERMSQQLLVAAGGIGLNVALSQKPELTKSLFLMSYGVGSTLGTLAYSRQHEYEADRLGMVFMALAGYDPSKSIEFWERMSKHSGASVPAFLSTHPSDERRIKELKEFLPKAMKYYKQTS